MSTDRLNDDDDDDDNNINFSENDNNNNKNSNNIIMISVVVIPETMVCCGRSNQVIPYALHTYCYYDK